MSETITTAGVNVAVTDSGFDRTPYGRFAQDRLAQCWETLRDCVVDAVEGHDPDAAHDLRVATRRLRAAFDVFGGQLPRKRFKRATKTLRRLRKVFKATRDWDVHEEHLTRLTPNTADIEQAAIEFVLEWLNRRRRRDRETIREHLNRIDLDDLGAESKRLVERLGAEETSAEWKRTSMESLATQISALLEPLESLRETERIQDLHLLRIGLKKLRYHLEWLEPLFTQGYDDLLNQVRTLQDLLGRHHDRAVLADLISQLQAKLESRGRDTLVAGLEKVKERVFALRQSHYQAFQLQTKDLSAATWITCLQQGLRLEKEPPTSTPETKRRHTAAAETSVPAQSHPPTEKPQPPNTTELFSNPVIASAVNSSTEPPPSNSNSATPTPSPSRRRQRPKSK